ncbi:MAG: porin family protein [Roseateles sp.]
MVGLAMMAAAASAAEQGIYVGGGIGSTRFESNGESESKTSFGATLGYTLNENVAFELQVRRLGEWKIEGSTVTANAVQASILGILPIANGFSVYGRLGYGRNSLDVSYAKTNVSVSNNELLVGAGAAYHFTKNLSARAEYNYLGENAISSGTDDMKVKIGQFNLGMNYAF